MKVWLFLVYPQLLEPGLVQRALLSQLADGECGGQGGEDGDEESPLLRAVKRRCRIVLPSK